MPARFETLPTSGSSDPKRDLIDTSKRYDVYCAERNQEVVVYRNALFKSAKTLCQQHQYDTLSVFMELEQADGQTIFIARSCIIKFCEHCAAPSARIVSGKET